MYIIRLCLLWVFFNLAQTQHIPQNNCKKYFEYVSEDNGKSFLGIFTAPISLYLRFEWIATFVVHGHREVFVSPLLPYPNKDISVREVLSGRQNKVYVYFLSTNNELPKLTHLSLNRNTLCNSTGYGIPSTKITVQYILDQSRNLQYREI